MSPLPYTLDISTTPKLGLIVLQADETIEHEMRHLMPQYTALHVSRVPSGTAVTPDTLAAMADHLTRAASLFPRGMCFDALGYACTSGAAHIGTDRIADLARAGADAAAVTDPITALIAACRTLGLSRIGFVSPYIGSVSAPMRDILRDQSIDTPAFGSFEQSDESTVVRIDAASLVDAGAQVAVQAPVDALFLSCTNLRTLSAIPALEDRLGIPVMSSNLVLAWHMAQLTGTNVISPSRFLRE